MICAMMCAGSVRGMHSESVSESYPHCGQTHSDVERSLRGVPLKAKASIFMAF